MQFGDCRHSRNGCYGILDRTAASVRLDVGRPDHLAPLVGSPADFSKLIADETEKWGNVIRALNIKAD